MDYYYLLNRGKNGLSGLVSMVLLLMVGVVAVVGYNSMYTSYISEVSTTFESGKTVTDLNIEHLGSNLLYIKNPVSVSLKYNKISVDGVDCNLPVGNISSGIEKIDLGPCMNGMTSGIKEVVIITDKGVFSQSIALQVGSGAVSVGSTTIEFDSALTCDESGGTKIYGLDAELNSHAEISSGSTYPISLCVSSENGVVGTDCSASISKRLFYLGNYTNSHAWIDNSTAYDPLIPSYYDWQEVCISLSSGSIDVVYNVTNMTGVGYSCFGSIWQDDVYGGMLGDCNSNDSYTKIWVMIN